MLIAIMLLLTGADLCSPRSLPSSSVVFAQIETDEQPAIPDDELPRPRRETLLAWVYKSLGIRYSVLLGGSSLLTLIGAVMIVRAARHPAPLAAYMFVVAIPMMIGFIGGLDGMIIAFSVLADPTPQQYWQGAAQAIVAPLVGMLLAAPSYLLIAGAVVVKCLRQYS
jgi:hypothetical protein